jgi:hypothetical protein
MTRIAIEPAFGASVMAWLGLSPMLVSRFYKKCGPYLFLDSKFGAGWKTRLKAKYGFLKNILEEGTYIGIISRDHWYTIDSKVHVAQDPLRFRGALLELTDLVEEVMTKLGYVGFSQRFFLDFIDEVYKVALVFYYRCWLQDDFIIQKFRMYVFQILGQLPEDIVNRLCKIMRREEKPLQDLCIYLVLFLYPAGFARNFEVFIGVPTSERRFNERKTLSLLSHEIAHIMVKDWFTKKRRHKLVSRLKSLVRETTSDRTVDVEAARVANLAEEGFVRIVARKLLESYGIYVPPFPQAYKRFYKDWRDFARYFHENWDKSEKAKASVDRFLWECTVKFYVGSSRKRV